LRARRFDELDIENVAEEIEALGRSDKRQFRRRIAEIIQHKLKLFLLPGGGIGGKMSADGTSLLPSNKPGLRACLTKAPACGRC